MKGLTILQPYAELVARAEKRVENRTWRTHYRGPLAIHAGLKQTNLPHALLDREPPDTITLFSPRRLDFGAIIAVVDLVECLHFSEALQHRIAGDPLDWLADHPYATGPWC